MGRFQELSEGDAKMGRNPRIPEIHMLQSDTSVLSHVGVFPPDPSQQSRVKPLFKINIHPFLKPFQTAQSAALASKYSCFSWKCIISSREAFMKLILPPALMKDFSPGWRVPPWHSEQPLPAQTFPEASEQPRLQQGLHTALGVTLILPCTAPTPSLAAGVSQQ